MTKLGDRSSTRELHCQLRQLEVKIFNKNLHFPLSLAKIKVTRMSFYSTNKWKYERKNRTRSWSAIKLNACSFFHVNNFTLNPFDLDLRIKEVLSVLCNAMNAMPCMHNTINKQTK